MVLAKVALGRMSAGRMTFWVTRLGNPAVGGEFLNTPSPKSGRGTGVSGILAREAGAGEAAYACAADAGSGGGPV